MCGISLIINRQGDSVAEMHIRCMTNKVNHRGPDGEGFHFGRNFAMGHRRLSIVDLSDAGLQPMYRSGDSIIFNGMIYNYIELKQELLALGYKFYSQTDTEVLLIACQHWGVEAFKKLNGMWAFAWYRASDNKIFLCRDYYGIKPLYFTSINNLFAAASEIKQFTSLPGFIPILNKTVAVNYLVDGSLNFSDQTFFKDVKELRAGHYLEYDLNTHQHNICQWYDLSEAAAPRNVKFEDAVQRVRELFADSLTIRMRAHVKIGSCLSGGIDSSAIVSFLHAHRLANDDFATITSCYTNKLYDEQLYSDQVSLATGLPAIKVYPDLNQLFDSGELDKMLYHHDQPFTGGSHYSEYSVFKTAAANGLTVMLDGQGADEYLGGYDEFFTVYIRQLLASGNILTAFKGISWKVGGRAKNILRFIKCYLKTVYWYPFVLHYKRIFKKTSHGWLNDEWKKIADNDLIAFKGKNIRDLSLQQMTRSSLPLHLHSEDRNSMVFSVESRLPFLDHRLVEYVVSLPAEYKIKNGISKYILREAIPEMPTAIKQRTDKMGFVAPDEPWVRENSQRFRRELKDAIDSTDIFSDELLKQFDQFIKGKRNFEHIYFRAIALNRFIKVFKMQFRTATQTSNEPVMKKFVPKEIVTALVSCSHYLSDANYY